MAELFMKDGGTCRGAGGSMHLHVSSKLSAKMVTGNVDHCYLTLSML